MRTGAGDPFLSLHPNSAPAVTYGCSRNIDCETGLAKWMDIDTVSLVDAKSGHGETLNAGDIDSDTWLASPVMCMSACEGVNKGSSALSPRLVSILDNTHTRWRESRLFCGSAAPHVLRTTVVIHNPGRLWNAAIRDLTKRERSPGVVVRWQNNLGEIW